MQAQSTPEMFDRLQMDAAKQNIHFKAVSRIQDQTMIHERDFQK